MILLIHKPESGFDIYAKVMTYAGEGVEHFRTGFVTCHFDTYRIIGLVFKFSSAKAREKLTICFHKTTL